MSVRPPGTRGYFSRNLRYMPSFAEAWPDVSMLQRSVARLPWRHQIVLREKLTSADLRLWYATEAVDEGWSSNILALQIDRRLHERTGKAISNFATTLPPADSDMAQQVTKDPYVFDFIGLAKGHRAREVEDGQIRHVERFLLELGQGSPSSGGSCS